MSATNKQGRGQNKTCSHGMGFSKHSLAGQSVAVYLFFRENGAAGED
jgi:hypothetical protein